MQKDTAILTELANAIFVRKEEASEVQSRQFYKHITHDWNDPLERRSAGRIAELMATAG